MMTLGRRDRKDTSLWKKLMVPRSKRGILSHPGFDAVPISGPSGSGRGDCGHGKTTAGTGLRLGSHAERICKTGAAGRLEPETRAPLERTCPGDGVVDVDLARVIWSAPPSS